jgi:hypothetical protein
MPCIECGTEASDNARFCRKCGAQLVPQKSLGEAILLLGGVALVVALILIYNQKQERSRGEDQRKPAVIAAIRQRYSPSNQLLALSPDLRSANWSAHKSPTECTHWHPKRENCWMVFYRVNVMPGSDVKEIKCEWLIDMDTMEEQPENTEARTMFVKIT